MAFPSNPGAGQLHRERNKLYQFINGPKLWRIFEPNVEWTSAWGLVMESRNVNTVTGNNTWSQIITTAEDFKMFPYRKYKFVLTPRKEQATDWPVAGNWEVWMKVVGSNLTTRFTEKTVALAIGDTWVLPTTNLPVMEIHWANNTAALNAGVKIQTSIRPHMSNNNGNGSYVMLVRVYDLGPIG